MTTAVGTVTLTYAIGTDGYYMMVSGNSSVYTVDGQTVQALCLTARQLKADTRNSLPKAPAVLHCRCFYAV